MALINNLRNEYKANLALNGLTNKDLAAAMGITQQQTSLLMCKGKIVTDGFLKLYEAMGYDIKIEYIPRQNTPNSAK